MVTKQRSRKKLIIFSNMKPGYNCPDGEPCQHNCDCDYISISDERINLNRHVDGRIIAIASLGLWNGRRTGYKLYDSNIASILYSDCDYVEWYSDGYNIKSTQVHHDGTNYIEYRVVREDRNIENLATRLYHQEEVSRAMINHYTKSLHPYVAQVYGWK